MLQSNVNQIMVKKFEIVPSTSNFKSHTPSRNQFEDSITLSIPHCTKRNFGVFTESDLEFNNNHSFGIDKFLVVAL